jgi:hypothetical protein
LQGTQNPDTKPTLQRAKNANAQPTHPGRRISINISSTLQQYIFTQHHAYLPPKGHNAYELHFKNQQDNHL